MKDDLERIRHKTGIDRLEIQQRKKLFREFVQHGGQIQEEKHPSSGVIFRTHAQKKENAKTPTGRGNAAPSADAARSKPAAGKTEAHPKKQPRRKRVKVRDLVRIYVHGLILRVITPSGRKLSGPFIDLMNRRVRESLLDLDVGMRSFLKGEGSIRREIHHLSVDENSAFYEFLLRISHLYEKNEFESLLGLFSRNDLPGKTDLDLLKKFFKRLYILGPHEDLCRLYTDKAIDIKLNKKLLDPAIAQSLRVQLKNDINVILGELIPRTHLLLCRIDRRYYPLYSQELDDFLEMTEQDRIGYITQEERKKRLEELKWQKEYIKRNRMLIQRKEEAEVKPPKHVERGFALLEEALEKREESHSGGSQSGTDPVLLLEPTDKMYRSIILFDYFDDQYSFILTTSKISFNIDYKDQKKLDIKGDLNKSYLLMSEAREEVREYININLEIKKANDNLHYTTNERELAVDSLVKQLSVSSRHARRKLAEVMKTVESVLSVVINDYNASRRLLVNPETVLYFDRNIDGEKRLHGKKTIEAIVEAFLFSSSFAFILNFGQLSGSGLNLEPVEKEESSSSPSP
jgi:hypothetical protein